MFRSPRTGSEDAIFRVFEGEMKLRQRERVLDRCFGAQRDEPEAGPVGSREPDGHLRGRQRFR